MKKLAFTLIVFLGISFNLVAQEKSSSIGISYTSFGQNFYSTGGMDGTPNYDSDNFYYIGLSYSRSLKENLELLSGIEYSKQNILGRSVLPNTDYSFEYQTQLIEIPINLKLSFTKYFFVNAGALLDFDISNVQRLDNQSGIGFNAGLGVQYPFESGIGIYLNPCINTHAIIPFKSDGNHQSLTDYGLKIGVNYKL